MTEIIKQMSSRNDQKKILVENYLCHSSMKTNVYQVRCVQTLGIFFGYDYYYYYFYHHNHDHHLFSSCTVSPHSGKPISLGINMIAFISTHSIALKMKLPER